MVRTTIPGTPSSARPTADGRCNHDDALPIPSRIVVLAVQADTEAFALAATLKAYAALERFITPEHPTDTCEDLGLTRAGLGAVLRALNGEMERRVGLLVEATGELNGLVEEAMG